MHGRRTVARAGAVVALWVLGAGCNLVFGVGDPTLGGGGGGGLTTTGTGGEGPTCVNVVCDDTNICTQDFCDEHFECAARPNDAATPQQIVGDCTERTCQGGVFVDLPQDEDTPPSDGNPCTTEGCDNGVPTFGFYGPTHACNGMGTCNGSGLCSICTATTECGTDNFCAKYTCTGQCGVDFTAAGTELPPDQQVLGDCSVAVCTGASAVPDQLPFDADIEDDGNDCTEDGCSGSGPTHDPLLAGKLCSTGVCNGAGLCVKCVEAAQCAGNQDGPVCLASFTCGCKVNDECHGKYGRACLASQICGCNVDEDCQYSESGGKFCNTQTHRCGPTMAQPI